MPPVNRARQVGLFEDARRNGWVVDRVATTFHDGKAAPSHPKALILLAHGGPESDAHH